MWKAGNLEDDGVLSRMSFFADLTIVNDYEVVDAFVDKEGLVNVDAADTTKDVGDEGNDFIADAK
jgi:hypothetical protein